MAVETISLFSQVIEQHLELKRRNATLSGHLPIDRYTNADPFENHPLFKTEEQARLEETMDGVDPHFVAHSLPWPADEQIASPVVVDEPADGLWGRSRDFDWGD